LGRDHHPQWRRAALWPLSVGEFSVCRDIQSRLAAEPKIVFRKTAPNFRSRSSLHPVDAHGPNCRRQNVAAAFSPNATPDGLSTWHNEYNNAPRRSSSTEAQVGEVL
jgi:hypothetical protein